MIISLFLLYIYLGKLLLVYINLLRTKGYEVANTNGKEQEALTGTDLVIINPPTTEVVNGQWVDPCECSFLVILRITCRIM